MRLCGENIPLSLNHGYLPICNVGGVHVRKRAERLDWVSEAKFTLQANVAQI